MFDPGYDSLPPGVYQTFVSRPDLRPPLLNVNGSGTPGLIFFSQDGADVHQPALIIADNNGDIVYVNNSVGLDQMHLNVQHLNGRDYLTFWGGKIRISSASGNFYMKDDTLNIAFNTNSSASLQEGLDFHDFKIIDDTGTAIHTFYYPLEMNLTKWGGPANGFLQGSGIRHVDLNSGKVLFEWRCTDHVSPDASLIPIGTSQGDGTDVPSEDGTHGPWDYFHINSVDMHPTDGTFLVSARHTSSIYKISNNSDGDIIWTITGVGGKPSGYGDFYLGPGASFSAQHHVRWRSPTEISIYDNEFHESTNTHSTFSRGLRISIDTSDPKNFTISLLQELLHPTKPKSKTRGSFQYLSNGNYWLGYGGIPLFAEFSPEGDVISSYQISPTGSHVYTYRSYKSNFTTNPSTIPDIAIENGVLYMSWNGATQVKFWSIYSSSSGCFDSHSLVRTIPKTGFETNFTFPMPYNTSVNFTRVIALNDAKDELQSSRIFKGELYSTIPQKLSEQTRGEPSCIQAEKFEDSQVHFTNT